MSKQNIVIILSQFLLYDESNKYNSSIYNLKKNIYIQKIECKKFAAHVVVCAAFVYKRFFIDKNKNYKIKLVSICINLIFIYIIYLLILCSFHLKNSYMYRFFQVFRKVLIYFNEF